MSTRIAQLFITLGLLMIGCCVLAQSTSTRLPSPKNTENPDPPNYKPVLVDQPRIYSGTFFTASGGDSIIDWQSFGSSDFVSFRSGEHGGASYGFGTGFRFYSFFGIEGGFVRLPTVKGEGFTNAQLPRTINSIGVSSWMGYVLARFYVAPPIFNFFYFTLGAGVTYRSLNPKPSNLFTNNQAYYYAAIYNFGAEWDITQNWFVFMNYFYIPEHDRDIRIQSTKFFNAPSVNLFLFGIGYKFAV